MEKTLKKGLALDIDETLSFTIGLLVEKLMEGAGNPENLTAYEIARKYKHTDNISYWQNEAAKKIITTFISSDEFYKDLPLIENAKEMVAKINKIIPIVAYITVRSEKVIESTKFWLKKHNFPEAELITKPSSIPVSEGNKWKAGVLEYLYPQVVGIVDDNPNLTNFLSKDYKGTVFLYDHNEAKRNDIKVIPCEKWEDVAEAVRKSMINNIW